MSEVVPPELSLQIIFAPTIGISLLSINSKIFPFTCWEMVRLWANNKKNNTNNLLHILLTKLDSLHKNKDKSIINLIIFEIVNDIKIKSALISVFSKDGLEPIVEELVKNEVKLYSTGGTYKFISDLGYNVTEVENITEYPSIFGGRVKTLHPKIFGGILYRRNNENDINEKNKYKIPNIDLVIVDLYPFEETVKNGGTESEIIEKIDIGGIALIRAAAKNFNDVVCISSVRDYTAFLNIYIKNQGVLNLNERKQFARKSFLTSSTYDKAIFDYFDSSEITSLRYGENPHQDGVFSGKINCLLYTSPSPRD